jgi:hypothetical protein
MEILRDEGPYTSVAAGMNVVCAIRNEGTTAGRRWRLVAFSRRRGFTRKFCATRRI